ncbi:MAG: 1-deoxy-D-xylulose-5-phosphate reductoisomerase [Clostridia bacterium]|nr:1-deoxy-D-xylulose-5-phosphate reductoisomerase [Clostridia bacterium]
MIKIALLGSTGSIGTQVLNVVDRYPDKFKIVSLAAGTNAELLEKQINKYKPRIATIADAKSLFKIREVPSETSLYYGENASLHAVTEDADVVFSAMVGFSGLSAVHYAVSQGKTVALANKETLVAGGEIITNLAKQTGSKIIPVDSEHSAIWQALNFNAEKEFSKLIITASGGAFRNKTLSELETVTSYDALNHPTWKMGKKITIDCATMMNKAFEVIEAMWLFNAPKSKIDVLIHPESIVHSMVEFSDGAVIAQMGVPSMELPIQLALTYPNRFEIPNNTLNLAGKSLNFLPLDREKYPCFAISEKAIEMGYNFPCALSGADESAVELFLQGKIKYTEIATYIEYALSKTDKLSVTYDNLVYTDGMARKLVNDLYLKRSK